MIERERSKKALFAINNLTSASCVAHVERTLQQMIGVREATVDFATSTVLVEYDPAHTSLVLMKKVLDEVGYEVGLDHIDLQIIGWLQSTSKSQVV